MAEKIERGPTGIQGLDKLIEGGIINETAFLFCGTSGSGKSTALRETVATALKRGEKCLMITTDETTKAVIDAAEQMGFGFKGAIESDQLMIIEYRKIKEVLGKYKKSVKGVDRWRAMLDDIKVAVKKKDVSIIAIDSISSFTGANGITRADIENLYGELKDLGVTCVMSGEAREGQEGLTVDGISEFKADTVVVLNYSVIGVAEHRTLYIKKCRRTKHSEELHPISITKKGIVVKAADEAFGVK